MKEKVNFVYRFIKHDKSKAATILLVLTLGVCLISSLMLLKISNDDFVAREEIYLNGDYQLAVDIGNKPAKIDEHLIEETITVYDYTIIRNDDGSFIQVKSVNKHTDMQGFHILEGLFPKSPNEILISKKYARDHRLSIGDIISIQTGIRVLNEKNVNNNVDFSEYERYIKGDKIYDLKISGIYNPDVIENAAAITDQMILFNDYTGTSGIEYIKLKPSAEAVWQNIKNNYQAYVNVHGENLLLGKRIDNPVGNVLLFITVITVILLFFLISNVMSIIIKERSRQYGVLKSIGAEKKQIFVLSIIEICLYALVAIPAGIALSLIIITFVLDKLEKVLNINDMFPFTYELPMDSNVFIWIIIFLLFLIILSCVISIKPILKTEAISLIRETSENRNKIKHSFYFTEHLFGIECMIGKCYYKQYKKGKVTLLLSLTLSFILLFSGIITLDLIHYNNTGEDSIIVSFKNINTSKQYEEILQQFNKCVSDDHIQNYVFKSSLIMNNIYVSKHFLNEKIIKLDGTSTISINVIGCKTKEKLFNDIHEGFLLNDVSRLDERGKSQIYPYFNLNDTNFKILYPVEDDKNGLQLEFELLPDVPQFGKDELNQIPTLYIPPARMKQIIEELQMNRFSEFAVLSTLELNDVSGAKLMDFLKSVEDNSNGYIREVNLYNNQILNTITKSYFWVLTGITFMVIVISVTNLICIAIHGVLNKKKEYAVLISLGIKRIQLFKLLLFENTLTISMAYLFSIPFSIALYCVLFYLLFRNTAYFYIPWKYLPLSAVMVVILIVMIVMTAYHVLNKCKIMQSIYDSE